MKALLVLVSGFVFLYAGEKVAVAQDDLVESHAYLYTSDDMSGGRNPIVVIQQPGTIRPVGCFLETGKELPKTPADLLVLLRSPSCVVMNDQITFPTSAGLDLKLKLFHQKKSDRYIVL